MAGVQGSPTTRWLNALCSIHQDGELFTVWVAGTPLLRFSGPKNVDAVLAAAILAESGTVRIGVVLEAFGIDDVTLLRARRRLRQGGAGAVILGAKRGPKGPTKLVSATVKRIQQLFEEGVGKKAISRRLGVSEFSVRQAVKGLAAPGHPEDDQPRLNWSTTDEVPGDAGRGVENAVQEMEPPQAEGGAEPVEATGKQEQGDEAVEIAGVAKSSDPQAHVPMRAGSQAEAWLFAMLKMAPDGETETVFESRKNLANAGLLTIVPVVEQTGLLQAVRETFEQLRDGVYGLRAIVLVLVFLALLRRPRPENLKGLNPAGTGDVLGLLRVPEVKTVRRKLSEIAGMHKSHELVKVLARRWLKEQEDSLGSLYIDGHVRVYSGKRKLPKAHVTQRNLCVPATTDYWVNDKDGKPVFVITAKANAAMTKQLLLLLDEIEAEIGKRRGTLVFDRGGWSIELFKAFIVRGWDILTYRKGKKRKHARKNFNKQSATVDGKTVEYTLSEKTRARVGKGLTMREIAILRPDGRQTLILTTHKKEHYPAAFLACRMFGRWRQENYFKYMKENFALDALVDYDFELDDPAREVPNPARKKLDKQVKDAKTALAALEQEYGAEAIDNVEAERPTMRGFKVANGDLGKRVRAGRKRVDALLQKRAAVPKRVPIQTLRPKDEIVRLSAERKVFTDAVKAATYRAESALVPLLQPYFRRSEDEARDFLKTVFKQPGDLIVDGDQVTVRFSPLSAPRFTAALRGLCSELNKLNPRFPESTYRMAYAVSDDIVPEEDPSLA